LLNLNSIFTRNTIILIVVKYKIKKFFYHESLFKINLLNKYRQNTSLKNPFMI